VKVPDFATRSPSASIAKLVVPTAAVTCARRPWASCPSQNALKQEKDQNRERHDQRNRLTDNYYRWGTLNLSRFARFAPPPHQPDRYERKCCQCKANHHQSKRQLS
jgi:hypothetical protein